MKFCMHYWIKNNKVRSIFKNLPKINLGLKRKSAKNFDQSTWKSYNPCHTHYTLCVIPTEDCPRIEIMIGRTECFSSRNAIGTSGAD